MIEQAIDIPGGTEFHADVCIVGAGAAGISLALSLSGTGLKVLLIEGGQLVADKASQSLYDGEVANPALHSPPIHYRQRSWGGSTNIWGGRCVPFDPQDFEAREAVPNSGWPINYEDVAKYYAAANLLCEAGPNRYKAGEALPTETPSLFATSLNDGINAEGLERFSCPTNFGRRYRARLSQQRDLRIVVGANVTNIKLSTSGESVQCIELAALDGRQFKVHAKANVLSVGGLEVPRLLLASNQQSPAGIGNAHGVVGRYYMCHLAGSVGSLELNGPTSSVRHGYEVTPEGIYCRRRIALSADRQREANVANLVARLHFPMVADPQHGSSVLSGIFLARKLLSYEYSRRVSEVNAVGLGGYARHVANVLRYPHDAIGFLAHWMLKHNLAPRRFPSVILKNRTNRFSLEINAEQAPIPESRVTLCEQRDVLGVPKIRVDWRYAQSDISSVARSLQIFAAEMKASGLGTFDFDPDRLESDLTCHGAYGGHHIGTARMGSDPKTSVVDANCRLHGIKNLFVAGSAVFPTSSQANPTLTLIALSLRLSEKLVMELSGKAHDSMAAVA